MLVQLLLLSLCVLGSYAQYNYAEVLGKSILFFEAQRSGKLPGNNRIHWRGDSAMGDGSDVGKDLTGGWYDAGDYVKFGFPMASATTVLLWGLIEFRDAYSRAGELDNMLNSVRWPLDYFLKAKTGTNEFYAQVGNGDEDHKWWGRPEDMTMWRPSYKVDAGKPGSDVAGETAAALAAGYMAFASVDQAYANRLLQAAKELFAFADRHRGKYSDSIPDAKKFYGSTKFEDELGWAAAWLWRATGDTTYRDKAESLYDGCCSFKGWAFSWDEKVSGVQLLMYITETRSSQKSKYSGHIQAYLNDWLPSGSIHYTPKGLAWRIQWGSNRYAANSAALAVIAAKYNLRASTYKDFARKQIHYMLGDFGRSLVVGYGNNPPQRPHHGSSSCPWRPAKCDWNDFNKPDPNPHVLNGALVGGPGQWDEYEDRRNDYVKNEVACDYNAGFQTAVAGLLSLG